MRVLHSWLRRYVDFSLTPEELSEKLGLLGLEVERIERLGSRYDRFVVGKIIAVSPHPNSGKLTICTVDIGRRRLSIVCGAPNVAVGQKVPVALEGAVVPRTQHNESSRSMTIASTAIRGVQSDGMICSEYELDLGIDSSGIMVLRKDARIGSPLAKHLGLDDVAYDLEVTPNRPDWLSHIGVAREIAGSVSRRVKVPPVKLVEAKEQARRHVSIHVEDRKNCRHFAMRVIRDVNVGPSPEWLQRALLGVGLRSVNNIVDVTNFVMMETGQPLHAFDLGNLRHGKVVVRQKEEEGPFVTLDGSTVVLPKGVVMVCDAEREVSIAGVMGGANSQITKETRAIALESASWNPSSIRRASKILGQSTEASYRFERGVDPRGVLYALDRSAQLIAEVGKGTVLQGFVEGGSRKSKDRTVALRTNRTNQLLGTSLSRFEIKRLLGRLGITAVRTELYRIPSYRVDIEREIDLIEEVARSFGYDRIVEQSQSAIRFPENATRPDTADDARRTLIGFGFQEIVTNPLKEPEEARIGGGNPVEILNPGSGEMSALRTSLIPGLLSVVGRNLRHRNEDLRLFEIGHVFTCDSAGGRRLVEDFLEGCHVAMALVGLADPAHWQRERRKVDIFDLKGEVQSFLAALGLDKCRFISYSTSNSLVEEGIAIESNGGSIGFMGKARADSLNLYGIDCSVFVAELRMEFLVAQQKRRHMPVPRFPRVKRDLAFIIDRSILSETISDIILASSSGLVKKVDLFDVYEGERLPLGKKSLAFSLELTSMERTLTDEEVDHEMEKIVRAVEIGCNAVLRSSETE